MANVFLFNVLKSFFIFLSRFYVFQRFFLFFLKRFFTSMLHARRPTFASAGPLALTGGPPNTTLPNTPNSWMMIVSGGSLIRRHLRNIIVHKSFILV